MLVIRCIISVTCCVVDLSVVGVAYAAIADAAAAVVRRDPIQSNVGQGRYEFAP